MSKYRKKIFKKIEKYFIYAIDMKSWSILENLDPLIVAIES